MFSPYPLNQICGCSVAALHGALSGAQSLLSEETQGLAFDFTDFSALIRDTGTPANNYDSSGYVTSGALVGPGGKLTYTSPSNKLCRQSDGYYKYGAHNLYLNSASPANQSITVVSGASYAVTITGTVSVTASGAATGTWTAGTNTFTAATTTLTLGSTSGSGTVHVYRTPAVTDYVATAGSPVYALPYSYAEDGSCEGLLMEVERTNLITSSADASGILWAESNSTFTVNVAVSPSGQTDADLHYQTGGAKSEQYQSITSLTAASTVTCSTYYKAAGKGFAYIQINGLTGGTTVASGIIINLSTGAIGSILSLAGGGLVSPTAGALDVGNGWYRLWLSGGIGASNTTAACYFGACDSISSLSATANATDGVYRWGAQLEIGSFPTSPIITYGSTATRAADQKSQLTSTFPLSATAGSLYAYVVPYAGSDLAGIVSLNDGSGDEEIVIYKDASANIVAQVEDGGTGQLAPLDSTVNASSNTAFKVALAWAANDFAISANGTAAQTDAGGTLPTVTTLEIGADQANNYFNGIIKAISYVPRRKSNAELAAETT